MNELLVGIPTANILLAWFCAVNGLFGGIPAVNILLAWLLCVVNGLSVGIPAVNILLAWSLCAMNELLVGTRAEIVLATRLVGLLYEGVVAMITGRLTYQQADRWFRI
jgi:hypothetical protein